MRLLEKRYTVFVVIAVFTVLLHVYACIASFIMDDCDCFYSLLCELGELSQEFSVIAICQQPKSSLQLD